jgi:AraC-like DNA-binding protein
MPPTGLLQTRAAAPVKKCPDEEDSLMDFVIHLLGTDGSWGFLPHEGPSRLVYQLGPFGRFRRGRDTFMLRPGDVLVVREGELSGEGEGEFIHVEFPPVLLDEAPDVFGREGRRGRRAKATVVNVSRRNRAAFENILIGLFRERENLLPGQETAVRARILELLTFLYRARHGVVPHWQENESVTTVVYRHRVRQVIHHVTSHLSDRFTLRQLAAMSGLNRTTFSRIHKTITGESPMRLLARVRIERAQQLLTSTTLAIGEIAEAVGYSDLSTFFRSFRRHCGVSPETYRKREAEREETQE